MEEEISDPAHPAEEKCGEESSNLLDRDWFQKTLKFRVKKGTVLLYVRYLDQNMSTMSQHFSLLAGAS